MPNRLQWSETQPYAATARRLLNLHSGSGAMRLDQYRLTLQLVASHPLVGLGPGEWQTAIGNIDWHLGINRNAHSDYLRALSDGGFPAAGALVVLYLAAFVAALRARRRFPEAAAFVVTAATISAADALLYRVETAVLVFFVLGWVETSRRQRQSVVDAAAGSREAQVSMHSMPGVMGSPSFLHSQGSV
jgi:O-antigen ligase